MAYPDQAPETENTRKSYDLIRDAFSLLGYELIPVYYPNARCTVLANGGEVDGLPHKVWEFNQSYPNLLRVNVPVITARLVAYSSDPELKLEGWESLVNTDYRVGYFSGTAYSEEKLASLLPAGQLRPLHNRESALEMVYAKRIDFYIDVEIATDNIIGQKKKYEEKIFKSGIMEEKANYIFLHEKHRELILPLEEVLERLTETEREKNGNIRE
ncbi:MAG: transporter substrate-binding domain-containing protein [Spirochaetales bacterium]|nr:transporter substrate-binding domain-containing protein [Spirochaetales bacterium]